MTFTALSGAMLAGCLFLALLGMIELGRRLGISKRARHGTVGEGLGAVEGAVFGLLGLLIAFTFSGAASRFDDRRALIIEEANDIGTAWLRISAVPPEAQPALREKFREYADARIAIYRALPDVNAALGQLARANAIQGEIWALAVPAAQAGHASAPLLLLPAINSMFDIANTRFWSTRIHPPPVIFVLLVSLALCCGLFAGYGMAGAHRNWLYMLGFSLVLSGAVFVIVDIEFPRLGVIRLTDFDQAIVDVRKGME
jgi:hypothetical protein